MIAAPIAVRLLERQGLHLASRYLAYIGYTWMGLLFFFFWLSLCLDIFNLSMRLLALVAGSGSSRLVWTGRNAFVFLGLSVVLLGIWSMVAAWQIRLDQVLVETKKLPAGMQRLTIAQISDVHLGPMVGERRLNRIIRLVRRAEPDLVICTGDLVDAQMDSLDHLAEMLAEVKPPLGKFAVTGNHEFYAGIRQSERFLEAAGFILLRNQRYSLDNLLTIVGMDDRVARRQKQDNGLGQQKETALLANPNSQIFTLLLKHRPELEIQSLGKFDLQLSGHTHGGQIFPFNLITRLFYPKQNGLYRLDEGSLLYVSRGTGTWGPPMRFPFPPHVTLIELARIAK
jgi:predicted MPP superfamily phosphohydrolase